MEKFTAFTGIAMPLTRADVDTDQIVPSQFMKRITKTGYEDALFHAWRQHPDFILNEPRYQQAQILIAGPNFGAGSSREHAVWALRDYGFRAVFSSRIADIFRGNAGKQGLLAATIDEADITRIWQILHTDPDQPAHVDLETRTLSIHGETFDFSIDDDTRARLLEGLDEIAATLEHAEDITAFEARRPAWLPRTLPYPAPGSTAAPPSTART